MAKDQTTGQHTDKGNKPLDERGKSSEHSNRDHTRHPKGGADESGAGTGTGTDTGGTETPPAPPAPEPA